MRRLPFILPWIFIACESPSGVPDGIEVFTTLSHAAVAPGDTLLVTVTIRNSSERTIRVHGPAGCVGWIELRRVADGAVAFEGIPKICILVGGAQQSVAPGTDLVDRFELPVTAFWVDHWAGANELRGSFAVVGYGHVWSSTQTLKIGAP